MIQEKLSAENLALIFPDYADNNFITIQEELVDTIAKRIYLEPVDLVLDTNYKNLISLFRILMDSRTLVVPKPSTSHVSKGESNEALTKDCAAKLYTSSGLIFEIKACKLLESVRSP